MKLNKRKIFSIVIAGISLFLIIFSFLPYAGAKGFDLSYSLWSSDYRTIGVGVTQLIVCLCLIAVYLLHLFMDLKEKWVKFANYGVGFIFFYHLLEFFNIVSNSAASTRVGFWFEFIFAIGLATISVLWYFMSEQPFADKSTPIIGYDQTTGKPIYAKVKGYDPKTGKPIYDNE